MSEVGTIVKNVVEYIVSEIVEDKKSVKVDIASSSEESVQIEVRTSPDDMGRVIGKRGGKVIVVSFIDLGFWVRKSGK